MATHVTPVPTTPYLESSARLRKVSRKALLDKVLEIVIRDQLIVAVLGDDLPVTINHATKKNYTHPRPRRVSPGVGSQEGQDQEDHDGHHS